MKTYNIYLAFTVMRVLAPLAACRTRIFLTENMYFVIFVTDFASFWSSCAQTGSSTDDWPRFDYAVAARRNGWRHLGAAWRSIGAASAQHRRSIFLKKYELAEQETAFWWKRFSMYKLTHA
jgi:hypothetical protein